MVKIELQIYNCSTKQPKVISIEPFVIETIKTFRSTKYNCSMFFINNFELCGIEYSLVKNYGDLIMLEPSTIASVEGSMLTINETQIGSYQFYILCKIKNGFPVYKQIQVNILKNPVNDIYKAINLNEDPYFYPKLPPIINVYLNKKSDFVYLSPIVPKASL